MSFAAGDDLSLGIQPAGWLSHQPGSITCHNIPGVEHHCPLASTKLYCLVTEARACVCVCVCVWTTCPGSLRESTRTYSYRKQIARQLHKRYYAIEIRFRGHSMSLKVVPFKSLGAVFYSPSVVTMAVSIAVCQIFSVKEWCDLENRVRVRSRSLEMAPATNW